MTAVSSKPRSYSNQRPKEIEALFDAVAPRYDCGNAVLSFQLYRLWNRFLIQRVLRNRPPGVFLDLCCGTGDIALGYLQRCPHPTTAYLLDFSTEMLARCRQKAARMSPGGHELHYVHADALQLPLSDASVDAVVVAYGIRNVADPLRCLQEALRVLRPEGQLGILELTRPTHRWLRWGHRLYLSRVLPWMASCFSAHPEAYDYLGESILAFMPPFQLLKQMQDVGFRSVSSKALCGGIATAFWATK